MKQQKKQSIKFGIFAKILVVIFIVSLIPLVTLTFLTIATYEGIINKYLPQEETVLEELFLTQHNVKIQIFLIAFLVIILTVFAAILISRYFFRPIKNLVKGTKEISAGNLDFRIKISSKDELGQLGQSFNQMTRALKKSRSDLQIEKNKIEAVISSLVDSLIVVDMAAKIVFVNPQAEIILGIRDSEIFSKSLSNLAISTNVSPLIKLIQDNLNKDFSSGPLQTELALLVQTPKGKTEEKIFQVTTVPVADKEGGRWGVAVILHDITRERFIEKMKTEFVSIAAHQLRTPLSAVKWALHMLIAGDIGRLNKEQKDFVSRSYQTNERMITLVNDLLNVTRIEEGRFGYKFKKVDFLSFIEKIINENKEPFAAKQVFLECIRPKEHPPKLNIDPKKLRLAIQNILDNARDYTLPGGKVIVSIKKTAKAVEVAVQDTGVGIPQDQMNRLFTKFFRGVNIIKLQTEGNGLGLFITKNIIDKHGGKIWAKSKINKGSTFYFTIPIK